MIVNHTHKFIFIHVPKAAGTSLTALLARYSEYRDQEIGGTPLGEAAQPHYWQRFGLRKHSTADEVRRIIGESDWRAYYKFAFVRDPLKRLISAFRFLKEWDGLSHQNRTRLEPYHDVEGFLRSKIWRDWAGPDNIFLPQAQWLTDPESNKIIVDFVGKMENMEDDIARLSSKIAIDLTSEELRHMNRSFFPEGEFDMIEFVNEINEFYDDDCKIFGY